MTKTKEPQKRPFINARKMSRENPEKFYFPSEEELNQIRVGVLIKVCPDYERFWAIVNDVDGDDIYCTVDNDLISTKEHGYECGDLIVVSKDNVYDIDTSVREGWDMETLVEFFGKCLNEMVDGIKGAELLVIKGEESRYKINYITSKKLKKLPIGCSEEEMTKDELFLYFKILGYTE